MSGGINFGSLTIFINGKADNLTDYDKNGDGVFQHDELIQIFEENELDTFNLRSLNQGKKDDDVTADSFMLWGARITMEEVLRELIDTTLSKEFIGKLAQYQSTVKEELRVFLTEYLNSKEINDIDSLAKEFTGVLQTKYEEVKEKYIAEAISDGSVNEKMLSASDEVITDVINNITSADKVSPDIRRTIKTALEEESLIFINSYNGGEATFKMALNVYLGEFLENSEKSLMQSNINDWKKLISKTGEYISQNKFGQIKNQSKKFLENAVNNEIYIVYNGVQVNLNNIDNLLNLYSVNDGEKSNPESLIKVINNIADNLSDVSKLESIISGETNKIIISGSGDISVKKQANEDNSGDNRLAPSILDMIDKVINSLYADYISTHNADESPYKNEFGRALEKEAVIYMETHKNEDDTELMKHLSEFMNQSIYSSLSPYIDEWNAINS